MSSPRLLLCASFASVLLSAPRLARAGECFASAVVGPAYFHNDDVDGQDSSGYGVAAQLDIGGRLTRWLALHSRLIADDSRAMSFDGSTGATGEYVTTVLGLGIGATASWQGWSAGLATGAQLTWHPDPINPNDGPSGAGVGPFLAANAGYAIPVFDDVQLGAQAFARYRVGKDDVDPAGYQLGLGLSVTLAEEHGEK